MTAKSAKLRVVLYAGETVVDESDDVSLWQLILGKMRGVNERPADAQTIDDKPLESSVNSSKTGVPENGDKIAKFAQDTGISVEQLVGAFDPQPEAPYVNLDTSKWEAFVKNTPQKGKGSIPSAVFSATVLASWAQYERSLEPTQNLAIEILNAIGAKHSNVTRGIKNCAWLQTRGQKVILNPAEKSRALKVLKAFALGESMAT